MLVNCHHFQQGLVHMRRPIFLLPLSEQQIWQKIFATALRVCACAYISPWIFCLGIIHMDGLHEPYNFTKEWLYVHTLSPPTWPGNKPNSNMEGLCWNLSEQSTCHLCPLSLCLSHRQSSSCCWLTCLCRNLLCLGPCSPDSPLSLVVPPSLPPRPQRLKFTV